MKSTIPKDELLQVIRDNREKHIEDYEDAVLGWLSKTTMALNNRASVFEDALRLCQDGKKVDIQSMKVDRGLERLKKPTSYLLDYDRAIKMIELHVEDYIEIDDKEFSILVLDEWGWKSEFYEFNRAYIEMVRGEV